MNTTKDDNIETKASLDKKNKTNKDSFHNKKNYLNKISQELDLTEKIKQAILTDKKKLLFCEGEGTRALDKSIYEILFPEYQVIQVGDCKYVKQSVKKLNHAIKNKVIDNLEVRGIIDNDTMTLDERNDLKKQGILPLNFYSVESIYYHPKSIKKICDTHKKNYTKVIDKALEKLIEQQDRLCILWTRKKAKRDIKKAMNQLNKIEKKVFSVEINYPDNLKHEQAQFNKILSDNTDNNQKIYEELITRYNIKRCNDLLTTIAYQCGCVTEEKMSKKQYEIAYQNKLLTLAKQDKEFCQDLKQLVMKSSICPSSMSLDDDFFPKINNSKNSDNSN